MQLKSRSIRVASLSMAAFMALGAPLSQVAAAPIKPAGTSKVGTSCTVTGGANKGSTGTYSIESDGRLWCKTASGDTDCSTRADGSSYCKDGKSRLVGTVRGALSVYPSKSFMLTR